MIYYLTIILVILLALSLVLSRDLLFPPNIFIGSMLFSVFCALLNKKNWNLQVSNKTFVLLLIFIISFIVGSCFVLPFFYGKSKAKIHPVYISITPYRIFLVILFQLIVLTLFIINLKSILGSLNSTTLGQYRMQLIYSQNTQAVVKVSGWITQLLKVSKVAALVAIYVLINNHLLKKNDRTSNSKFESFLLCVSVLLYIPVPLLNSTRFDLIILFIYGIVLYFILSSLSSKKNSGKVFFKVIAVFAIILFLFRIVGGIIGRDITASSSGVTTYFGGSIALLNDFLKYPAHSTYFGEETFQGVHKLLTLLGFESGYHNIFFEFRSINGISIGNVYTAIRNYYYDFGFFGVVILSSMLGFFFSFYYLKILYSGIKGLDVKTIFYALLSYSIFLVGYQDFFYSTMISLEFATYFVLIFAFKEFYLYHGGRTDRNEISSFNTQQYL